MKPGYPTISERRETLAHMEERVTYTDSGTEESPSLTVSGETPETGVTITTAGDRETADSAGTEVEGDTGEHGYETEILGDGMPPEDLREPRDNYTHSADHTFENDVTIAGTLRTKRWIHPHGCMFQTYARLLEEYPNPEKGMWAFVGTSFPGKVWICEKSGEWREADPTLMGREEIETLLQDYATEDWVREELRRFQGSGSGEGGGIDHAVEADHAKTAYDLDADSPVRKQFLSRTKDDTALGLLKLMKGAQFGNFMAGLYGGTGGRIDERGNGELESLVVRTALTVMELVVNQQSIQQGDTIFAEGDTIDTVEPDGINADGTRRWWVTIRERYDGYMTAIVPGMVLRGVVNNLFDAANPGAPGSYYTSFMRVNGAELGTSGNRLNVTVYADDEVPAGRNYPPCPLMTLARWGHQTIEGLQRLFKISSHEGSLVRYEGITRPIIDLGNVATFIGRCPEGWFSDIPGVEPGDEIAYFKTVLGNFIQMTHQGKPVPTIVYTGEFDPDRAYLSEDWQVDSETGLRTFVTESCGYKGCVWLCMKNGVRGVTPSYGVTSWAFYQGNPAFTIDFEEKVITYNLRTLDMFGATLTLVATLYNQDVLPLIPASNITWSRESYDADGVLRAASDAAWRPTTDRDNKRLLLTKSDFSYDGTDISKITFICRASIDDTLTSAVATEFRL